MTARLASDTHATATATDDVVVPSTRIDRCRSCGSSQLHEFLDLGETPLANALRSARDADLPEPRFPLVVAFCRACTLVQITETVHPELLFRHYLYASSYSDTMLRHARAICDDLCATRGLGPESLVVEIASNDGYLLQYFAKAGVPVLGIEPARNIAALAVERGIPTRQDFFSDELARELAAEGIAADVILANNVLAHVADLNGFVHGVARLLKPDGTARIEFPYLGELLRHLEFDTIYHEHLCYFSAHAIEHLLRRHGLVFADAELMPIHGGTLRVTAALSSRGADRAGRARVEALLREERERGLDASHQYDAFAARVEQLAGSLRAIVHDLKAQGKRIAAYGASAKGSTLLNYVGLGRDVIDFVVDRSLLKRGLLTPGTGIEILPPEHLLAAQPDFVLLLTWNFAEEILAQQQTYRERGGRFIIPLPEPHLV